MGLTAWATLTMMRGKWMKIDKTTPDNGCRWYLEFFSWRQHFHRSLFLNITLSSPNLQTRGIVPSLLLSGQPFQSINWTRVRGKFLLPKQHLSEHMSPPKWMNRPLCLPFPFFAPSHSFHSLRAVEEGEVLLRTVWVMREISGRDALEVGTLRQNSVCSVCERV